MRFFLFGAGKSTLNILSHVKTFPENIKFLGVLDDDSSKWGRFIASPQILQSVKFDKIIIPSKKYFHVIKDNLMYWHHINEDKIENSDYLLKILMTEKYKNSQDAEIQDILKYWQKKPFSVFNQYVTSGKEIHTVHWDCIENMPYIIFEDKRMYFPYNHRFHVIDGKKVVVDILMEQQPTSPHLYITDDIRIEQGDVVADAGVCEGNFALRYIEKISKLYLFESDQRWIKPLQKTFEKFSDKVVLCNKFLGANDEENSTTLDTVINGRLDFLKMDIEGAEEAALLGGKNTLCNNHVKCAICSYHKSEAEMQIKDILQSYGYATNTSKGYMVFPWNSNIFSTLDFRRGIVYARKDSWKHRQIFMDNQNSSTSSFLDMLAGIKEQLFSQKSQAIACTEQMIQSKDSFYVPQIFSYFPIGKYQLPQLDADMRKLSIICEIVAAEEKLPDAKMLFLEQVKTFDDLIQKYVRMTFLLRRLEFHLPEEALRETAAALIKEQISVCALRKITDCEIFADGNAVYSQALKMIGGTLK